MKADSVTTTVVVMMLLALPVAAPAQFGYVTNFGVTITITSYAGSGGEVAIPGTIDGLPVVSIGGGAFQGCAALASVVIPDTVTNIGAHAFAGDAAYNPFGSPLGSTGLTSVALGAGVTTIGDGAFSQCYSLASVALSSRVLTIGNDAFYGCINLTNIVLPDSVTNIGSGAFRLTGLTNIVIPGSVTTIGSGAFDYCYYLTGASIGKGVKAIGDSAFDSCFNLGGVYFAGNAPALGQNEFYLPTAVYCQPGMTGWDSAGYAVILWNPQVRLDDATFGVHSNQFGFNIAWTSGSAIVVEACTNLFNPVWVPMRTLTFTNGSACFSDLDWTNHPHRFYRLKNFTRLPVWSGGISGDDTDMDIVRSLDVDYASRFRAGDAFVHYVYSRPLPRGPYLISWAMEAVGFLYGFDSSNPITQIDMSLVQQMKSQEQGP